MGHLLPKLKLKLVQVSMLEDILILSSKRFVQLKVNLLINSYFVCAHICFLFNRYSLINNTNCVIGTQSEIEAALEMIKDKFPEKRFPNFSLQEISAELYQRLAPLVPEFLQVGFQFKSRQFITLHLIAHGYLNSNRKCL